MCARYRPSNEKLDTKQRGGGRKFSYARKSNLSRDHIKKATRLTSCERGKEDEQAAKEAKKMNKLKDYAARVQTRAMADMAIATLKKVAILED
jgi:hypothetical protein